MTLFSAIDETVADRSDYISATQRNVVYETTLSPITQPVSGSDIVVNFDASSPADTGSIKFDVLSGSTVVKSQTVSLATNVGSLYLPRRWKQQPQGAVQIDWGNSITRGLKVALHPVNGRFYDVTRYAPAVQGATSSITGSPSGVGLNTLNVVDSGIQAGTDSYIASQYNPYVPASASILVVGFSVDPYWHNTSYVAGNLGGYGAGVNAAFLGVATAAYSSGRQVEFRLGTQGYDGANLSFPNLLEQGKQFAYGSTRVAGANGHRAFSSGRYLGAADGGTSGVGQYPDAVRIGNGTYWGTGNTTVLTAFWERALSDAEMVSVTSEPWQIFKPLTRRIVSTPRAVETSFNIKPDEYSVIDTPKFGRFLPQRWRKQPQGNVEIDWNNPLTKGLLVAMAPGSTKKQFFRLPSDDPQFITANFGSVVKPSSSSFVLDTPFGRGHQGIVYHSSSSGGNGVYVLNPSDVGGSPVISYGAVFTQLATPNPAVTSGFSYSNGAGTLLSIQSSAGAATYYSRQYDTNLDLSTNAHTISLPSGVQSNKLLTASSTWVTGQPGRSYYGRELLVSANTNAWDGAFTTFSTLYLTGYVGGTTAALLGVTWLRALTDNDRAAFDENPWQLFRPNPGRMYGLAPAGGWPWTPTLRVTSL